MHFVIIGTFKPATQVDIVGGIYRGYFDTEAPQTGPIPPGQMKHDRLGQSVIGKVHLDGTRLEFVQVYEEKPDEEIRYVFDEKQGNVWKGTYEGPKTPKGYTKCVIVPVDLSFLV